MEIINVNESNLNSEHICCAISDKKGENCVALKKAWLKERFSEGLLFKKLNVRGKVFIEFIPAETAWAPILAPRFLYINCFWVSGQYKGHGHGKELLEETKKYALENGFHGLTILSSEKKKPFLSDPGFLKNKGFTTVDRSEPWFELLSLPLSKEAAVPSFKDSCRLGQINLPGTVIYYSDQCPHTEKYAFLVKEEALKMGRKLSLKKITTLKEAQSAPTPFTTYSVFHEGKFISNEILSVKKYLKLSESWGF
jgi:ribosomal protein S18 acetylase RimI-like enzyme